MKTKVKELNQALKNVHKRFLENERLQAEQYFEKKIAPFEFLLKLTQDKNFEWLRPFSALIAEIDAFSDEAEVISSSDLICINDQINFVLRSEKSKIAPRYGHHLNHDADFIMLHSALKLETKKS